ncbi:cytoplasmic protein [Desulfosediminicola ganghwensis]|uniref:cytoplasmic protein n=1 Tax=Desulfosediminicola ganghwensis TaxID=2569540 RepID=UPI0010AD0E73|nr:cytoplasmic protein [Desulfosediminicola ganghwensis]
MKKIALIAYTGELVCFSHVLLYCLDYHQKGYRLELVIEGAATRLITDLGQPGKPFAELYDKVCKAGLIGCICLACSKKMGSYDEALRQGLTFGSELQGHPSLERFTKEGYEVMTF